ncbi:MULTISPECIES: BRO family protein [unclassified Thalassospira]|uniref:BRO-N domain-containing protein n=1 Tax=unclassified Thalassospira TaxID=2648997 RepID=UPI0007A5C0D0|nr:MULTISPECIES: BRO family protein [unclassified Thalassospira]KZC99710.1 hypothetical protein AUQ41_08515 [Thalassospira sp. MCCC 1A02898]ONH85362.1 hypothetical protein TH47_05825 [Thalassospira sp. MCCC 1A02803]
MGASSWSGFEPPATSAVVESLSGGAVESNQEGFDMTKHDTAGNLPATLTFQDTELSIIDRDGVPWLIGAEVARALGYASAEEIGKLYRRHKDEFTEAMSLTVKLTGRGHIAPTNHRIYSPRGAQLIAMLAKTDRAKDFRRWVLDVLEKQSAVPPAGPSADAETRAAVRVSEDFRRNVVSDVVTLIMNKIGPQIAASQPRTMPPLTKPDDPMPRLIDGHAVFRMGDRMVIVDTNDYALKRGERAVVLRMEDGEFPQVVTILGAPYTSREMDRCMIFDSGVQGYIPVGAVLGRVVWEGACYE